LLFSLLYIHWMDVAVAGIGSVRPRGRLEGRLEKFGSEKCL
jgi:hypothetical protein